MRQLMTYTNRELIEDSSKGLVNVRFRENQDGYKPPSESDGNEVYRIKRNIGKWNTENLKKLSADEKLYKRISDYKKRKKLKRGKK